MISLCVKKSVTKISKKSLFVEYTHIVRRGHTNFQGHKNSHDDSYNLCKREIVG